jgi:hypothetical protein
MNNLVHFFSFQRGNASIKIQEVDFPVDLFERGPRPAFPGGNPEKPIITFALKVEVRRLGPAGSGEPRSPGLGDIFTPAGWGLGLEGFLQDCQQFGAWVQNRMFEAIPMIEIAGTVKGRGNNDVAALVPDIQALKALHPGH